MLVLQGIPIIWLIIGLVIGVIVFLLGRRLASRSNTITVAGENNGVVIGGDNKGTVSIKTKLGDDYNKNKVCSILFQSIGIISGGASIVGLILQLL